MKRLLIALTVGLIAVTAWADTPQEITTHARQDAVEYYNRRKSEGNPITNGNMEVVYASGRAINKYGYTEGSSEWADYNVAFCAVLTQMVEDKE
jgi:hypothetical protein